MRFRMENDSWEEATTALHRNLDQLGVARIVDDLEGDSTAETTTVAEAFDDGLTEDTLFMSYKPANYIATMHAAPRFGHSNALGKIASSNSQESMDYASGLKQFTLFVVVPFIIWGIILVLFKFLYGIPKIGCAAGGEILDMKELSKRGISRKERRRRILRSWRIQSTFMICGILVPTVSLVMMKTGWSQIQTAWVEVQEVVDDVEALAFRGWNAMDGLQQSRNDLIQNKLVQALLEQSEETTASSIFASWCPNANSQDRLSFLHEAMSSLESDTDALVELFDSHIPNTANSFMAVTESTKTVDESIEWFFEHDWIWKMYLMTLNVLNFFLLMACYGLSKHNIIHAPTRMYLTFFIVPLFSIGTFLLLMVTASSGVATLLNSDFCAGGESPGSPQGTIQDAILSYQYGNLDRSNDITGTLGLVYESFTYYANDCLTEPPLEFLSNYLVQVNKAVNYATDLTQSLPNTPETVLVLSLECGADVSFLPATLEDLESGLVGIQTYLGQLVALTSCESISPLVRRLTHGAVCSESAQGLTSIWACSLAICILCSVMLTTRAALYNSIKKRKPREKKSRRAVEKEFEEYKKFMSDFYPDTDQWKMGAAKNRKQIEIEFGSQIQPNPTFETMATSKESMDEDDIADSDGSGPNEVVVKDECVQSTEENLVTDDFSYDSSYESDSDESESIRSDDGSQSAFTSFIVETRSIIQETKSVLSETKSLAYSAASRTISNFKSLRPLLSRRKDTKEDSEEEQSEEDASLFLHSPTPGSRTPGSRGRWDFTTPTENGISNQQLGHKLLAIVAPLAPQKVLARLARTKDTDALEHELEALTQTPSKRILMSPSNDGPVRPRRLRLSPFVSPDSKTIPDTAETGIVARLQTNVSSPHRLLPLPAQLNTGVSTPEPRLVYSRRQRLHSEDSDDISMYVEDAPKPPEKARRRLARTSAGDKPKPSKR